MIFDLNKFQKKIKINIEIMLLFSLMLIAVLSTTYYNNKQKIINENYKDIINNIYFKKSINHIFNNLSPRYKNIDHKISKGETFDKILKDYSISDDEIIKIKKSFKNDINLNNLKTDQIIKFTIDQSSNKKIINFLFPLSRTEKIKLTRNLETNLFKTEKIITRRAIL